MASPFAMEVKYYLIRDSSFLRRLADPFGMTVNLV